MVKLLIKRGCFSMNMNGLFWLIYAAILPHRIFYWNIQSVRLALHCFVSKPLNISQPFSPKEHREMTKKNEHWFPRTHCKKGEFMFTSLLQWDCSVVVSVLHDGHADLSTKVSSRFCAHKVEIKVCGFIGRLQRRFINIIWCYIFGHVSSDSGILFCVKKKPPS